MAAVVLDTDVSSRLLRRRLTGRLAGRLPGMDLCVTFVTVGELWKWAELRSWDLRARAELVDFLHSVVVLPYGEAVARRWGEMAAAAERRVGHCRSTTRGSRRAAWRANCRWRR